MPMEGGILVERHEANFPQLLAVPEKISTAS